MDNIYNFTLEERVAHCKKLLLVFDRLPDACFFQIRTTPSIDLVNRLKNKIHGFTDEVKSGKPHRN